MSALLSPSRITTKSTPTPRESSPSYFGLKVESNSGAVSSSGARLMKQNLSPSGAASIRSTATSPLQTLPFHSTTSEFDAFKREVERKKCEVNLNKSNVPQSARKDRDRPSLGRRISGKQDTAPAFSYTPMNLAREKANSIGKLDAEHVNRSPKRLFTEENVDSVFDRPRRESPASFFDPLARSGSPPPRHENKKVSRIAGSYSLSHPELPTVPTFGHDRADTLPEKLDTDMPSMISAQSVATALEQQGDMVLILDLRVYKNYADSRIRGALNLCVPTTLLKRPSYNVTKLADTFKDENQRSMFEKWRTCKTIIAYEANTSHMKDAVNCVNLLKKFIAEGWKGGSRIIRGGFDEFERQYPNLVESGRPGNASRQLPSLVISADDVEGLPPVIGGCPIPATENAANPFFGNIRQNTDLIGGVGQMPVHLPNSLSRSQRDRLPRWMTKVADEADEGKGVSDKFLRIEIKEQKRMQEALSSEVVYGSPGPGSEQKFQIAGIEKGAKNRYNNIWPFEHSRVKLQGVPSHACDYVNANFISTTLSSKSFIATQGPTPATFNDFWTMVWQRDVRVVVMLTALVEGGLIKAHDYWSGRHYGNFKLNFLSERRVSVEPSRIRRHRQHSSLTPRKSTSKADSSTSSRHTSRTDESGSSHTPSKPADFGEDHPYVVVRNFTLVNEDEPFTRLREITQLQYENWPDFGAPTQPGHLVGLVEQCDAVVRANSGSSPGAVDPPVLVHCSAGCGRTGTFCTVDSVLDIMRKQGMVNQPSSNASKSTKSRASRGASPKDVDRRKTSSGDSVFSGPKELTRADLSRSGMDWEDIDLIERTVSELRVQRLSMVQSLRQFVLCYEAVAEWAVMKMQEDDEE